MKTFLHENLCYVKPLILTSFWLSAWCKTPRRVYHPLGMEFPFLRINVIRHLRRKIPWKWYPIPLKWAVLCLWCYVLDQTFACRSSGKQIFIQSKTKAFGRCQRILGECGDICLCLCDKLALLRCIDLNFQFDKGFYRFASRYVYTLSGFCCCF